jgi:choline dehydrogenase/5-(hydroxymethyl)furfural/furfural oxidase
MFSYLVIGAGAAGSVVARRLSDVDSNTVTLLEAGPDHAPSLPPDDVGPYLTDAARIRNDTVVHSTTNGPSVEYAQGFGVGGSSLINGGIVVVGPRGGERDGHLLPLEEPGTIGPLGAALLKLSPQAAPVLLARRDGVRVTASDAYLGQVRDRPNLTIHPDHPVCRLLFDGNRAVGVLTDDGVEYLADRVVLCAGAIQTPTILLRSGVAMPGVGEGLQDHPAFTLTLELRSDRVDPTIPAISVTEETRGRQILALEHGAGAPNYGALIASTTQVRSTGRVTLPDPDGPAEVELGVFDHPSDVDELAAAVAEAIRFSRMPPITNVTTASYIDEDGTPAHILARSGDLIRAWVSDHPGNHHHIAASCQRGTVTDDVGAVRHHKALFIADASLFKRVPPSNPYLATILQAESLVTRWA